MLAVGWLIAPSARVRQEPPRETVAPILERRVESREPARMFRGVQGIGRNAVAYSIAFPQPRSTETTTFPDFSPIAREEQRLRGFGVIVSADGEALSHVRAIGSRPQLVTRLADGSPVLARVRAFDPFTGLVLLRLIGLNQQKAPRLAQERPRPGELAVAAARADVSDFVVPVFVASTTEASYAISQASGTLPPGTPIYNLDGEALAIAVETTAGLAAHPIASSLERLRQMAAAGRGIPVSLGISLQALGGPLVDRLGTAGALISDVEPAGPAARAGLEPGDVLVGVAGQEIVTVERAVGVIASLPPDAPTAVVVRRGRATRELEVTPEAVLRMAPEPGDQPLPEAARRVREVFRDGDLEAAGVDLDAWVLTVEGQPLSDGTIPSRLRRRGGPFLVHLQDDAHRFFAMLGAAP